jgi:hypothetical protein
MTMPVEIHTDCRLVDAELDRQLHGDPLSPPARQHLDRCPRCRSLYETLAAAPVIYPIAADTHRRIVANIEQSLKPVSHIKSTAALAAQLLLVFILLAAAVTSMMKLVGIETMNGVQLLGISAIFAFGVVLLSRSLAWQMTPGSLQKIPALAAVAILGIGVLAGFVILFPWKTPEAFFVRGWHCLRAGMALAVPAGALFWLLVCRGAPLDLTTLGGTLGAIGGLLSVTVLQFTCNLQDIGHLLTWHGGVLVISTVAGAVIGRCAAMFRSRHSS